MNYLNLEQRIAHVYLATLPPFVPLTDGPVGVESQEQFYRFMKNAYQAIFDSPELFFKTINADDAFPNRFNRASYGKPKLDALMKKDLKEIEELLAGWFALGQNGTVEDGRLALSEAPGPGGAELKKKYVNVLPLFGLKLENRVLSCEKFDNLFPAWKWMASRDNASVTTFGRCMFDPGYAYMEDIYARIFGDEKAFERLVAYLEKSGYRRVDIARDAYSVDYIKQKGAGNFPLGTPLHGDPNHYGLSFEYRPYAATPQFLALRILEMKNILLKFELLPENLKKFVLQHVKKCDDCGYCTQTDKTGKRKPLAIEVAYNGGYRVCPLYPGFNFCFAKLDAELAGNLMGFLDVMERVIRPGTV